jgi:radical SAM protein (TIGR01212 family)
MVRRFNSYSAYLKQRFGSRVAKLSVDAGFTCPNRDGSLSRGGCIYCNNESFVPPYARARYSLRSQMITGIEFLKKRYGVDKFIIYFQAYTNTYGDVGMLEELWTSALGLDGVVGISIGTRSDCIDEEKIMLMERIAKSTYLTVEYGIESIYDKTLRFVNRGHDYASVVKAISMTQGRGIKIGAHLIVGFPTETIDEMLYMATEVSRLGVDYLKVHNLHVVKNTPLEKLYRENPFKLFAYDEYVDFVVKFLERLSPHVVVERLFTDTPRDLLVAPRWGMTHSEILRGIELELERRDTYQGRLYYG